MQFSSAVRSADSVSLIFSNSDRPVSLGPAGAGKSTLCTSLITHLQTVKRTGHLFNLDPAATNESFQVEPSIDIRDLISLDDAMTELGYGPNGGLVYCFE